MMVSTEQFVKYTNVVTDDKELQESYLQAAQNIVEDYLGYSLERYIYVSYFDGNGTNTIQLRAMPIRKIYKILVNDVDYKNSVIINNSCLVLKSGVFPMGNNNVEIHYLAGYDGDKGDNAEPEIIGGDVDVLKISVIADSFVEENPDDSENYKFPEILKLTIMRIAALLQSEADGNIGVTSKSFGDSGTRTFINLVNFDKYLIPISKWRIIRI